MKSSIFWAHSSSSALYPSFPAFADSRSRVIISLVVIVLCLGVRFSSYI